jgi:glycine/D-amino acid oxidase-like deaminating enzyme
MPTVGTTLLRSEVCLYTNTRDEHFWLDWQDGSQRILVASACSGHGFKFSPVLGEAIANALTGSPQAFDLSLFRAR